MKLTQWLDSFITREAAARALGVHQTAISHYYTGRRKPKPEIAARIMKLSKGAVTLSAIYGK